MKRVSLLKTSISLAVCSASVWYWKKPLFSDDESKLVPPVPTRRPFAMDAQGEVRIDDFYWLRDNSRSDREIIDHLERENAYLEANLGDTKGIQDALLKEMKGRIKEDDYSIFPYRKGPYYYYARMESGKQFPVYCRRRATQQKQTAEEAMDESQPEEVLLDANQLGEGYEHYRISAFEVSPDHSILAYADDTTGSERYNVRFKSLENGSLYDEIIRDCSGDIVWANDNQTLFYLTKDSLDRPDRLWRHILTQSSFEDTSVYRERDDAYYLSLHKSNTERYIYLHCTSAETSEVHAIDANHPNAVWKILLPRRQGIEYDVFDRGNFFYYLMNENAPNRKIAMAPLSNPSNVTTLIAHQNDIVLEDVKTFMKHLVILQRQKGLPQVAVYSFETTPSEEKNGPKLLSSVPALIHFPEEAYSLRHLDGEFISNIARIQYSSLSCPPSVYDIDLEKNKTILKWSQTILNTNLKQYESKRLWAKARDGTAIPVSIVYRKDQWQTNAPLLIEGYGAYEMSNDPIFDHCLLSLLDRGIVYAIAHVRGGGELGRQWYEQGRYLQKMNTFTDFLDVCNYLIEEKYTRKGLMAITGRSAGGLLIGGILNMAPEDMFCGAIAQVPFVDVLTTMLDDTIPLTIKEREEWGDPRQKEYYDYIKSYSPYDNVQRKRYPPILVTAGFNDPRVGYWEPTKWVLKLRDYKTDDNPILLQVNLSGGHFSKAGRYDRLAEEALKYGFLLRCWGINNKI
eukprot:jgi/Galph1/5283/GphlegSOOS_G3911.1